MTVSSVNAALHTKSYIHLSTFTTDLCQFHANPAPWASGIYIMVIEGQNVDNQS